MFGMTQYEEEHARLLESIASDREDLQHAVEEVERAVQHDFALGEYVAANPLPWLVGAFLIGLWSGLRR
jgi:hypothetical protein